MRFFFYGTLLQGARNGVATALHRHLCAGTPATVAGRLHAIPDPQGWYPALTAGGVGARVHGMVHEVSATFTPEVLAAADAWEGYDPASPGTSDYLRRAVTAVTAEGQVDAEAYVYNRALPPAAVAIAGGDFGGWIAEHGGRAFGEAR